MFNWNQTAVPLFYRKLTYCRQFSDKRFLIGVQRITKHTVWIIFRIVKCKKKKKNRKKQED